MSYKMLLQFQNSLSSHAGAAEGVMPSKFCSGNICCDNHGRKKSKENVSPECKDFVIIGKFKSVLVEEEKCWC